MTAVTLERRHRRRSALQAFACPRHFKGYYVDHLPNDSQPARRGSAFHEVQRRYVRLLVEHGCSDDLDLARLAFDEGLAASMASDPVIAEVDQIWWRHVESFRLDVESVLIVEERPDDEYDWMPDLVRVYGDTLAIDDFKTHFAILNQTAAESAFQAKFYSARARRIWPGFRTYRFSFWFVRWGVIVAVEFSQADIDRHEEHLAILEAGIRQAFVANDWPAIPGETCAYCSLACPVADEALLHPARITSRAEAELALGRYLALERARGAYRRALEGWAAFNGPVPLNGVEFGAHVTSTAEFPVAAVLEVFRAHELEPTFSVSKTALKPYLTQRRYAHLAPQLEPLAKVKPGTEYRVRKVGDIAPVIEGADEA